MSRKKQTGYCRLCGVDGLLSYEHVPPKSAFNDHRVVLARKDQMRAPGPWDGQRGDFHQRGAGAYTLCERCNNKAGEWYVPEYARWARQAAEKLPRFPQDETQHISVSFDGRPLLFLKQVIVMFFSVNGPEFAGQHPDLVKFALDPKTFGLHPRYRIDMVLVRPGRARWSGLHGLLDCSNGAHEVASEMAFFPFAFRLLLSPGPIDRPCAIEQFADFLPDQRVSTRVLTVAGDVASKYPGDYRSRDQIEAEASQT